MNEFGTRLGGIAQNVSREFALAAPDDSAELVRRARRGRVVWTGTVGTVGLASAAAIAFGGSAAASGTFGQAATPAHHDTSGDAAVELVAPVKAVDEGAAESTVTQVDVRADKADPVSKPVKHKAKSASKAKSHSAAKKAHKAAVKDGSCAGMKDGAKADSKAGHHTHWKGDAKKDGMRSGDADQK